MEKIIRRSLLMTFLVGTLSCKENKLPGAKIKDKIALKDTIHTVVTDTLIKFNYPASFTDFKISIYKGNKTPINYRSAPIAREYRTVITNCYNSEGLNFAGHYCIATWGCGASCVSSAIIDMVNGNVYEGPIAPLGFDFKKDSRMLVLNPPDSNGFYEDCSYCEPEVWVWNEKRKKLEQIKAEKE